MLPDVELEIEVESFLAGSRKTGSEIATLLEPKGTKVTHPAGGNLPPPSEIEYHLVTKGCIYFGTNETTHRLYQKGDIFLRSPSLEEKDSRFHVDFAAESISITEAKLLEEQRGHMDRMGPLQGCQKGETGPGRRSLGVRTRRSYLRR